MTKRFRDIIFRRASSVKKLETKKHSGWRTTERSGSSHTLSRGSGFFPAHMYCPQHRLNRPDWEKNRKRNPREQGEELQIPVQLSTHILCVTI